MAKDSWEYHRIAHDAEKETVEIGIAVPKRRSILVRISILLSISSIIISAILYTSYGRLQPQERHKNSFTDPRACQTPQIRREWRTLNDFEKDSYILAVQCLMTSPSMFRAETSFYDDFIFAHSKVGNYSHYAAAFLPWHRMFIHLYEKALREKCFYSGSIPYWDWTLDSSNLAASPVWNADHGFGGNGETSTSVTLHEGHCVLDGPFSNTTRAWTALSHGHSHGVVYSPHCLSRGFVDNPVLLDKLHQLISPTYVQETLDQLDYDSFFKMFERGAHNAIPQFVRGDWLTFTAPNDPVFFLHHAQVDRLWWLWQEQDPATRLIEFHGPAEDFRYHGEHNHSQSSMTDSMPTGGLARDLKVIDFMDTENGVLCYRY